MNKYQTYSLLGKILALDAMPAHRGFIISELQRDDIAWERFVGLADHHLILQALYPKIRDHELLEYCPEELTEHLKYIFELTTARNIEIVKQSEKISKVLSKEGITPLFMKGVGGILDGVYKYPGERILHDIDILVPEEKFEQAAEALLEDGYQSNYEYDPLQKDLRKHYPILYKPGEPVYLEIHRMPVGRRHEKFFNTGMALAGAKHPTAYPDCLVMSDEHKIIHYFIHAQMDHMGRIYAREYMRNMYDILLLSGRKDPEEVFCDFGHFRRTSSGFLDITYKTFGITPTQRKIPRLFLHTYRFRFFIKLHYRFLDVTAFFVGRVIMILQRIFLGFVVRPFQAIFDKKLRGILVNKLGDPGWYRKQGGFYRRALGIGRKNI